MRGISLLCLALTACGGDDATGFASQSLDGGHGSGGEMAASGGAATASTGGAQAASGSGGAPSGTGGKGSGGALPGAGGAATGGAKIEGTGGAVSTGGAPETDQDAGTGGATQDSGTEDSGAGPCVCTEGACCDGCHFRPKTFRCAGRKAGPDGEDVPYSSSCSATANFPKCDPEYRATANVETRNVWCGGLSAECDGYTTNVLSTKSTSCGADHYCEATDTSPDSAHCVPCPH